MKRILLVDAMNMMYRSYYAMPKLKNRDGQCVGAVLGFLNSVNRFAAEGYDNAIVIWDPPEAKTRRHGLYSEYKMNRPPMDLDMKSQISVMKEGLDAFGLCQVVSKEEEADDVIATLTRKVFDKSNVCILSRDKDLAQLVDCNNRVVLLDPVSGDLLSYDGVQKKFGVHPESLRDALALAGDASDNIQGVPGIGMKTASILISKFGGNVENIYSNLEIVPGKKRKENLRQYRDNVMLAYELVRLEDDIPLRNISIMYHDNEYDGCKDGDIERVSNIPSASCPSTRQAVVEFCDHYHLNDLRRRMELYWRAFDDDDHGDTNK